MRVLLTLTSLKNAVYDIRANHKMQGFVYSLLKSSEYSSLHDQRGDKFFCFSNLFPIGDIKEGQKRSLLISSPNEGLIKHVEEQLSRIKDASEPVNIGDYQFTIDSLKTLRIRTHPPLRIAAATPIVIRIPEYRYEEYGILPAFRKPRYVYWRPGIYFTAFLKQMEENLFKKYNKYFNTKTEEFPLFSEFVFKKSVANHIIEEGREQEVIGSIWEFRFQHLTPEQKKILEFGLDRGFGERNSLGFGFVNIVK